MPARRRATERDRGRHSRPLYEGRRRPMTIELPESSAHQLAELFRSVPAAVCEPAGNCYYVSCIAGRGNNDERRSRQTAGTSSYHRRLDIRQAFRDGLEADPLRKSLDQGALRGSRARRDDLPPQARTRRVHTLSQTPGDRADARPGGQRRRSRRMAMAGDYIWRKPGSLHDNRSPGGAVLFAVYRKPNLYYSAAKETAGV